MISKFIYYSQNTYITFENCTISRNYYFQNILFFRLNIFTIVLKSTIINDCNVGSEVIKEKSNSLYLITKVIRMERSSFLFINDTFENNIAEINGVISLKLNVIGKISDSLFQNNSAGFGGAIFYNSSERNGDK